MTLIWNNIMNFLQNLQMSNVLNRKVKKYSLGMKQKLGILIASHKLEDIEEICDRFLFLKDGKIS